MKRRLFTTLDTTYEIYADENLEAIDQSSYVGEQVSDYRFEISSFDYDEVYVSRRPAFHQALAERRSVDGRHWTLRQHRHRHQQEVLKKRVIKTESATRFRGV